MRRLVLCCAFIGLTVTASCSTPASRLTYLGAKSETTPAYVRSIVGYVRCELARTVYDNKTAAPWLVNWSAVVDLTLSIDRKSAVSPNAVFTEFKSGRSKIFSNGTRVDIGRRQVLGVGLSAGTGAKRNLKITWFEDFAELIDEREEALRHPNNDCSKLGDYPVTGDIEIDDALGSAVFATTAGGLVSRDDTATGPLKVVEHQLTFQADLSANATPSIFLFDVSVNPAAPFLTGSQTQKNDLLITMGPVDDKKRIIPLESERARRIIGLRSPSSQVLDSNLAANIGNAINR